MLTRTRLEVIRNIDGATRPLRRGRRSRLTPHGVFARSSVQVYDVASRALHGRLRVRVPPPPIRSSLL